MLGLRFLRDLEVGPASRFPLGDMTSTAPSLALCEGRQEKESPRLPRDNSRTILPDIPRATLARGFPHSHRGRSDTQESPL